MAELEARWQERGRGALQISELQAWTGRGHPGGGAREGPYAPSRAPGPSGHARGEHARPARQASTRGCPSAVHRRLVPLLSLADNTRGVPEAGPQERLSQTGDNLPNVVQYLKEQHPERLTHILEVLRRRVPRLEKVEAELLADGRLLLTIKDAPFDRPVLARWASDGTLKMLAYLTVLYDPAPPPMIGIEEPENHLHPRLLPELAEECRAATERSELLVTTHSPFFVNGVRAEELWVLYRGDDGYTKARRAADMRGIRAFVEQGALLGDLWMENQFEVGDPLGTTIGPRARSGRGSSPSQDG